MLKLNTLFSDNAVFQQGKPIPIWGKAAPRSLVKCEFGGHSAMTSTRPDGVFLVYLPAMSYQTGLTLRVSDNTGCVVEVHDIAVGEVWLASGQSNIEFAASKIAENDFEELKARNWDFVRMYNVPKRANVGGVDDVESEWEQPTSNTLDNDSAVALYFAHELANQLQVTVGVIHSSWGGTVAEAWTSREFLVKNPEMHGTVLAMDETIAHEQTWAGYDGNSSACLWLENLLKNYPNVTKNIGEQSQWHSPAFNRSNWKTMELPCRWNQNGEPFNGTLWFSYEVEIPSNWQGQDLLLGIGAVDKHDVTYFNGVEVGRRGENLEFTYWDLPRRYQIPKELVKPGKNLIAVRAYSFVNDGGLIGPVKAMFICPASSEDDKINLAGTWQYAVESNIGWAQDFAQPTPGDSNLPHVLFDNMISPLIPYALKGVIWYQGESSADDHFSGLHNYQALLLGLTDCWRTMWGQGDFPFYQVLLANYFAPSAYNPKEAWTKLREAQLAVAKAINCPCASAIDVGDAADIHPKDKRTVAHRLALLALERDYHLPITSQGPTLREIIQSGNTITVYFDHVYGGLKLTGGESLFYIANAKMNNFLPAEVELGYDFVRLSNPRIPHPVFVRYAWAGNPTGAMLYNQASLPAMPFRNDNQ